MIKICPTCGKTFKTYPSWRCTYCSVACRQDDPQREQQFWARVDQSGGPDACWLWQGATDAIGYGRISLRGKHTYTHRVSYMLTHGPIPDDMFICHHCDNPPCCNPAHLFVGTALENIQDRVRKGRSRGRQ